MNQFVNEANVGLDFGTGIATVGRLAIREGVIYFEYSTEFLQKGVKNTPFRLPLQTGVIELPPRLFDGLAGV